jgi:hypothetical protein
MMIARWQIDARFGHKQNVIDMLRIWANDIAPQIGWTLERGRMHAHKKWSKDLEPYVVSGSARWEVYRIV